MYVLLRGGGGMGLHLHITLSTQSKREDFVGLLGVLLVCWHLVGACFLEVSKRMGVVWRTTFVCIGICVLPSCFTLGCLRIILRETPTKMSSLPFYCVFKVHSSIIG